MKKVKVKEVMVALLFIAVGSNYEAKAQVTIGSDILPEKGALLELKTLAPSPNIPSVTDPGNVTVDASGGGLGLPRVQLADRANLEPFISATDPDWLANTDNIKEHHAGLTVYNLTDDTLKNFRQGVYVWNGDQWSMMGGKRHFYMPSFNIEVKVDSTYECDLYEAYKRQFEKAGSNLFVSNNSNLETISSLENGDIYASRELDYVVTYYDAAVMDPPTIANDGKMTFTVTDVGSISAKTFFTVLLVVK